MSDEKIQSPRSGARNRSCGLFAKLRERYEGKAISTRELLDVFAEDLPPSLRYEGKASLDWFLEGWVNGTSLPRLELQSVKFTAKANGVAVTGVIRQNDAGDNLVTSVPIYAVLSGKAPVLMGRVFADGTETFVSLVRASGNPQAFAGSQRNYPYRT